MEGVQEHRGGQKKDEIKSSNRECHYKIPCIHVGGSKSFIAHTYDFAKEYNEAGRKGGGGKGCWTERFRGKRGTAFIEVFKEYGYLNKGRPDGIGSQASMSTEGSCSRTASTSAPSLMMQEQTQ